MEVPFFRPSIGEAEIAEVVDSLRSGWLTTGPKTKLFEQRFAEAVGAKHAIALNSCTAALHLALEALGVKPRDKVLVPTMTFAATAEVVRYMGADPVLVDCEPDTLLMDLEHARALAKSLADKGTPPVGVLPVHVAGVMMDLDRVAEIVAPYKGWVVEDAAHSFPASWKRVRTGEQRLCGAGDSDVTCFSFYANKTITTGEGGMATTNRDDLAERMRVMSLHGISKDAWKRYTSGGSWEYDVIAPGFKYNLTDIASAIGLHQLERAEALRAERERLAYRYFELLADTDELELPPIVPDRLASWHLYYLRLKLDRLSLDRAAFIDELKRRGIVCSVHWKPLHVHPYYRDTSGTKLEDAPKASAVWPRLITLPLFPGMREEEIAHVAASVKDICRTHRRAP